MKTTACPSGEELRLLSCGRVTPPESEVLLTHLERCARCQAEVDTVADADDSLIADLRTTDEFAYFEREGGYQTAMAKALSALAVSDSNRDQPDLPVRIGDYEIVRPLGHGGMGKVFLARQTKLGRQVALKLLADHRLANPRMKERFESEMRAIGRLSHPNIVTAHDAREIDGVAVLAMEYVEGFNLSELLSRLGPLSTANACEITRQIANALQYIDSAEFVHRDIKPSNVMLSFDGQVKLLDLGLARLRDDSTQQAEQTATGQTVGTADYVAPEQVCDSRNVDIRADIYSLGCTLFKLLTGKALFADSEHATTFSKMTAHVTETPPSLAEACPDAPAELVRLVDSMLQKSPPDRPQSATAIVAEVSKHAHGANLPQLAEQAQQAPTGQSPIVENSHTRASKTGPLLFRPVPAFVAVAAGLLGVAAGIALGVLVTIEHPDGSVTRIDAADGSKVSVEQTPTEASPAKSAGLVDLDADRTPDGAQVLTHSFPPGTPLEQAVEEFNQFWKSHQEDWSFRALKTTELIGAIEGGLEFGSIDDTGVAVFEKIAKTGELPKCQLGLTGVGSLFLTIARTGESSSHMLCLREPGRNAVTTIHQTEPELTTSNPELTHVRIPVWYADGRPAAGAEVTMSMHNEERPVEATGKADASGIALNRALPYGKYTLTVKVPDGDQSHWTVSLYEVLLEFGGAYSRQFIAPTPSTKAAVEFHTYLHHERPLEGLRFGVLSTPSYGGLTRSPEPFTDAEGVADFPPEQALMKNFPSPGNGIDETAFYVRLQVTREVKQTDGEPLGWVWSRREGYLGDDFILTDNSVVEINDQLDGGWDVVTDFHGPTFFTHLTDAHQVQRLAFATAQRQSMRTFPFAHGTLKCQIMSIYGKATPEVTRALGLEPRKGREVWLEASLAAESAWVPQMIDLSAWTRGKLHENLAHREFTLSPGKTNTIAVASPREPD